MQMPMHIKRRANSILINGAKTTGYFYKNKMNFDLYLRPYTKFSSEWIIDLNVKARIIKEFEGLGLFMTLTSAKYSLTIKRKRLEN